MTHWLWRKRSICNTSCGVCAEIVNYISGDCIQIDNTSSGQCIQIDNTVVANASNFEQKNFIINLKGV